MAGRRRDSRSRALEWGSANRPKTSNKLSYPHPTEGSNGDIQIRQTTLGAELFGKIGGEWYSSPLSVGGKTKFGKTLSNYLSIDRNSIDIFSQNEKVATFGAITTVKDINLTGKINITSTGTQNVCMGTGNNDIGTDNISIGVDAGAAMEAGGTRNISIGTDAGTALTTGDENICIGTEAGKVISTHSGNVFVGYNAGVASTSVVNTCLGSNAGVNLVSGNGNTYIGFKARASATDANNEVVLAGGDASLLGVIGMGSNTALIGGTACEDIYLSKDGSAAVWGGHLNLKERNSDPPEPAEGYSVIWQSNGSGKGADGDIMIASQAGGNTYYNTLFDHSASSSNTW